MSNLPILAQRIWRDGALRSLPLWLGVTLLAGNVLALAIAASAARSGFPGVPDYQPILVAWLPVALYLVFGKARARSHRLDLVLPIPARELWLAHTLALLIAAAFLLAATLGLLGAVSQLLARLYSRSEPLLRLLPFTAPLAAAAVLAVTTTQTIQHGAWKPAAGLRHWALIGSVVALLAAALVLLAPWPAATATLLLVVAAGIGYRTWSALPAALELAPLVEARARRAQTAAATHDGQGGTAAPGPLTAPRLLFQVLHSAPPWGQALPLVLYFFLFLTAFFLAGGFGLWTDLDESRILNLPLGPYMLFTGAGLLTYHLHRLDPLPISRRALFRLLVLPSMVVFCLGWAAGRTVLAAGADSRQLVEYRVAGEHSWVQVDPGQMGVTSSVEPPTLTAPWGESHPAWHRPLFRGSRLSLYSPYSTSEVSSARFEALMASRAIEAVYGEHLAAAEILDRALEVRADRIVGLRGEGLVLPDDWRPQAPTPARADTPVFLALTLVPWLLMLAVFTRSFRATSTVKAIRGFYWAGLGLLLVLLAGQVVAAILQWYSPATAYGLLAILCRKIDASPGIAALVWIGSGTVIYLSYRLAEAGFRRAELPVSPLQCALVDWSKED